MAMENFNWLFVGLGNPKPNYFKNRHNIGWSVIEKMANKFNVDYLDKTKFYTIFSFLYENQKVMLAFPLTYMNLSGEAVVRLAIKYKFKPENIVVLVDEYNFPLGKVHLRKGGSNGGHNGVASIIENLNNPDFLRLRLGIGKNFGAGELVDYVLSDFLNEELPIVETMKDKAIDALLHLIKVGFARATSDINSEKLWENNGIFKQNI
jgi:PTH1 family peptidyl-tRNA hydrolase